MHSCWRINPFEIVNDYVALWAVDRSYVCVCCFSHVICTGFAKNDVAAWHRNDVHWILMTFSTTPVVLTHFVYMGNKTDSTTRYHWWQVNLQKFSQDLYPTSPHSMWPQYQVVEIHWHTELRVEMMSFSFGSPCVMTISDRFIWNFEDVINFVFKIYCLKISFNDRTDFEIM